MSTVVPGSFRDRQGRVVKHGARIFRTLSDEAYQNVLSLKEDGALHHLITKNGLWPAELIDGDQVPEEVRRMSPSGYVLEHPRIEFISHPYEWSFSQLKSAALAHIDLHIAALSRGYNLSDGSAYNIQFVGAAPYFIDTLSLKPYREGDYWDGYRQFVEQFLAPLLLRTRFDIPFNQWFRGELEGVPIGDLAKLARLRDYFSPTMLLHVILHAHLQNKHAGSADKSSIHKHVFSKTKLLNLLKSLRNAIGNLKRPNRASTEWGDYEHDNSYTAEETRQKQVMIREFVKDVGASRVWDLGCNSGLFSEAALDGGAEEVIGFDIDQNALDAAYNRAKSKNIRFLPIFFNAMNPSPNQGWLQAERSGFAERRNADTILALAFIHHLVIGKNALLSDVLEWLTDHAQSAVIEFVPKSDPMIQHMLATREDIFNDYTIENFVTILEKFGEIVDRKIVSQSGRELFFFRRSQ